MAGKILVSMIISTTLALTGCWDASDLTESAMTTGVGVDYVKDSGNYRVTFQVINPREVAGGENTGTTTGSTVTVYSGEGKNIFEAARSVTEKVPRKIFVSHISLIVLGEELVTDVGVYDIIDVFARDHEFRKTVNLLITRGVKAEEVLKIQTQTENIPAQKILNSLETTEQFWGHHRAVQLFDVLNSINSKGHKLAISGIKATGDPEKGTTLQTIEKTVPAATLHISGMAVLKDGKLQHWLEERTSRGVLWVTEDIESTIVNLPCKDKKDRLAIQIMSSKTNISPTFEKDFPSFQITITVNGNVGEANCPIKLSTHDEIVNIEQQLSDQIKHEVMTAINATKEEESDIFGFGDAVFRSYPDKWKNVEDQWGKIFAKSEFNITVDTFIRGTGLNKDPFQQQ